MAIKKFSQFTEKTSGADSDYIVGYASGDNKRWSLLNIWNYIKAKADALYASVSHTHSNYTPYAKQSQSVSATTGKWVRIAQSASGVGINSGIITLSLSGHNSIITFYAVNCFNYKRSVVINAIGKSMMYVTDPGIYALRVVYKSNTYTGEYSYIEVYIITSSPRTLTAKLIDATGWTLTTGDGSVPSGYTYKAISLNSNPLPITTGHVAQVVTPSGNSIAINADEPNIYYEANCSSVSGTLTIRLSKMVQGQVVKLLCYATSAITMINVGASSMLNEVGINTSASIVMRSNNFTSNTEGFMVTFEAYRSTDNLIIFVDIELVDI